MADESLGSRIGAAVPIADWHRMHKAQPTARTSPVDALQRLGITRASDGSVTLSQDALRQIREDRQRRATISHVPSTSRFVPRDGGGVGVRKGAGRWDALTLDLLRSIRERAPVIQAIHAAREKQVRRMSQPWNGVRGEVGWRVVHRNHKAMDAKPPAEIQPYIERFTKLMQAPSPTYAPTTSSLLCGLMEDLLTINRPVVEKLYSALDTRRVVGFRPVDGGIIWPTEIWLQKWFVENPGWLGGRNPHAMSEDETLDLVSLLVQHDVTTAEYCLVREGILEAVYVPGRLIVAPVMNRTDVNFNGYWPSSVEQAAELILTFLNAFDYNASYFTRGMMAEFILGVSGDVHDDDIDAFVDMLREATQGVRHAHQPPVMPLPENGVLTKIDLKNTNREMMFEEFMALLIAQICAIYRMDPSTINAKPWDGGGGSRLGGDAGRGMEIALAKEEGLQGDLQHIVDGILTPLAQSCHPDLMILMEYGDFDPQKEATINESRARVSRTRNEIRLAEGIEPLGFWLSPATYADASPEDQDKHDQNLWNMPTDPGFVSQMSQQAQMAAQQAQGQPWDDQQPDQGPEDDGFGQPEPQAPFGARPGAQPGQQPPPQAGAPPSPGPGPQAPPKPAPTAQPPGLQKARRGRITVYDLP